jgi:NAD(P)-dependent dehydrogenase (short-subunit alcohol dehydrogenase family)
VKTQGKVAIVTGAAGGIGAALAQRLVENGARVVVTDLDEARVTAVAKELSGSHPGSIVAAAADASSEQDLIRLITLAEDSFGPVDIFAANAGVGFGVGLESSDADWQTTIDVNVMAHVRAARLLVPGWLERGSGYFLSTASAAGLLTQIGVPTYAVSKHGAVAFAEWLAVTYGDRGIAVSCLCPMGVNTNMLNAGAESDDATSRAGSKAVTDAGDVLEPLDVADFVLDAMDEERFLVLPHPDVLEFFRRKSSDYDRWIAGMQRYRRSVS